MSNTWVLFTLWLQSVSLLEWGLWLTISSSSGTLNYRYTISAMSASDSSDRWVIICFEIISGMCSLYVGYVQANGKSTGHFDSCLLLSQPQKAVKKRDWDKVSVDWWICRYKFQPTFHICSVQAVWRSPRFFNLDAARCKTSLYRWKFHARDIEPLGWYKDACCYSNALDMTKLAQEEDKLNKTSKSTNNKHTRNALVLSSLLPAHITQFSRILSGQSINSNKSISNIHFHSVTHQFLPSFLQESG